MCENRRRVAVRRKLERVVVVEDEAALRSAITRVVRGWGATVTEAGTAAEARALLREPPLPELVIVDVRLPDESACGLLDITSRLSPPPVVLAMSGKASPEEAFLLAQKGVRAYLPKPFSIEELESVVEAALREMPSLEPLVTALVGRVPMRELQREVRRVMVREALAQAEGSRSGAARLLDVSRQAVQQAVRQDVADSEPEEGGRTSALGDAPPSDPKLSAR